MATARLLQRPCHMRLSLAFTSLLSLAACTGHIEAPGDAEYLTCDHLMDHCHEDAKYASSIYAYYGRVHSCLAEHDRCLAVGVDEYVAAWRLVCPALDGH